MDNTLKSLSNSTTPKDLGSTTWYPNIVAPDLLLEALKDVPKVITKELLLEKIDL